MIKNTNDPLAKGETLREHASRFRRLASQIADREVARKLLELAREFEQRRAADKSLSR
jgi:hypothetical protein